MYDLNRDVVVLSKPVRRTRFVLGKSVALEYTDVAVMDDGTVRYITKRRPDYFLPGAPLVVSFVARTTFTGDNYAQAVQRCREMESQFITAELPELV
ncbi:hypothetical protein [Streptomyces werraensis]|uniref:hypothetical protein n=1 Tax=Streptomyces werraensis TaxID=68284 RepID=UPI0036FAC1FC